MSIRWIVWGEQQVGFVEAPNKSTAMGRAMQRFDTDSVYVTRVEAEVSYQIGEDERKALERNKRLGITDDEDGA